MPAARSTGSFDFCVILYAGPGKVDGTAAAVAALVSRESTRLKMEEAGLVALLA
jgi:hypothetical protein